MTVAPPLSAFFIPIVSSFAKVVIAVCSDYEIFCLTFAFSMGSRGMFIVLRMKLSKSSSLPRGGTKFELCFTSDSSLSSLSSKYSIKRTLRVNSEMTFVSSWMLKVRGVGVNFSPFSSNFISVLFSWRCDKLIICISVCVFFTGFGMPLVLGIKKDPYWSLGYILYLDYNFLAVSLDLCLFD